MRAPSTINRFVIIAAVAMLNRAAAAGDVALSQPPLGTKGDSFPAQLAGAQQADNWSPASTDAVTSLRWWGATSGAGEALLFTLRVYIDTGGVPTALVDQIVIGSNFTKTATGFTDINGREIFQYEATLPDGGFTPALSTTYWLAILNDQATAGGPLWLWHQGNGSDNAHVFRPSPTGSWAALDGDLAMELITTLPTECPSDFNDSGTVDILDLLIVIANWGTAGEAGGDANGDNTVNIADLLQVIAKWGTCN